MTPPRTFRVGLVGAGYISEFHIRALRRLPDVRIVGITDLDQSRARAVAERFHLPAAFPSLEAMASRGPDVVHVLTPPASHAAVALEAVALGCHVLVEKPLVTSIEDYDRLAVESRTRGVRVCVNHSELGEPQVMRALKAVRAGAVGEVLSVDILRSSRNPPYRGGPLPPRYREGGFPFRDMGVHALYLLQAFLGEIQDVTAEFRNLGASSADPNQHFDEWRALVRCERGMGHAYLSWNVRPLQSLLIVHGTAGTLCADLFSMFVTQRRCIPLHRTIERAANPLLESLQVMAQVTVGAMRFALGRIVPYQGLHNFVTAFYEALATGGPMPADLDRVRDIVHWTERIAREADVAKQKLYRPFVRSERPAIVVTGANGQLGRALVDRLLKEGERVRLFVRRPPSAELTGNAHTEVVFGDLGDPPAVEAALAGATMVFHVGAATEGDWSAHERGTIAGTRNVVEACLKHQVPKLVYVSSLSVLARQATDKALIESAPLEPAPPKRGYYTQAKAEAERIVREAVDQRQLPAVIVRPGQIWREKGPLLSAAVGIDLGRWLVIVGDGSRRLSLVHVDDVVEALVLAARSPSVDGEVFHVVDDDALSCDELATLYVAACGPTRRIVHMPLSLACAAARVIQLLAGVLRRSAPISPYRLRSASAALVFDCSKARSELGWKPRVNTRTELRTLLSGQPR